MKILGTSKVNYTERFIVEISLDEIAAVANKSAYRDGEELKKLLTVGADYPIAEGYDFRQEIIATVKAMESAHEKFANSSATMRRFLETLPKPEAKP